MSYSNNIYILFFIEISPYFIYKNNYTNYSKSKLHYSSLRNKNITLPFPLILKFTLPR